MRRLLVLSVAVFLSVAWMSPARADLPGIPNAPVNTGTGFTLAGDYGDPEFGGSAWGLTGGLGLGKLGFNASIGTWDIAGDDVTTFGAAGGLNVLQLGPVDVGAQVGLSVFDPGGGTLTDFYPGVNGAVEIPAFPLKPWTVVYVAMLDGADDEFRFTIGADLNIMPMLGLHASYDWGDIQSTWGVGAHFNFSVPGM